MDKNLYKDAAISEPINIADGVAVRMLIELESHIKIEGYKPRIQLVLVINEDTHFDSINRNRKKLKEILRNLDKDQGSIIGIEQMENRYGIVQWREEGISWGRLTMILNYLSFALTLAAYDERHMGESLEMIGGSQKIIGKLRLVYSDGGIWLRSIFSALGMTFEDLIPWIKQGYEYLAEDRFDLEITSNPFKKQRVIDKVGYFLERIKEGIITISENDLHWNALEHIIYYLNLKGYFTKIDELLDKEGMKDWTRNKPFLQSWRVRIFEKFEGSQDPRDIAIREFHRGDFVDEIVRMMQARGIEPR
jgi:hypothetical protein